MGLFSAGVAAGLVFFVVAGSPVVVNASSEQSPRRWGGADLSVRATVTPSVAQPGQLLAYRVKVHNAGPGDAVLPILTVQLPGEVDIVHVNVATCHLGSSRNQVVCPSSSDIPVGDGGMLTILGAVRPGARGPLHMVAVLSSEVVDDNETDNRAEVLTHVDEGADLAVQLSPATRSVRAGRRFTVRASVRNSGPRVVRDPQVYFTGSDARFVSARGARCKTRDGAVGCALRPIDSGSSGKFSVVFRMPRRGKDDVGTKATVYSARVGDRRPANNQASMYVSFRRGRLAAAPAADLPRLRGAVRPARAVAGAGGGEHRARRGEYGGK